MWLVFKLLLSGYAALSAVDHAASLLPIARLALLSLSLPLGRDSAAACTLCNEVMSDMLDTHVRGSEGMDPLPCNWLCLRIPHCAKMCESLKTFSANSTKFPCEAAGFCEGDQENDAVALTGGCRLAPVFRCEPTRLCSYQRRGFRFSCELRPGISRWIAMRDAVGKHATVGVSALYKQPRCGEPGAGNRCIASPHGTGAVAEFFGHILALGYAGAKTVRALETPGGDNDRQWLTYWVVIALLTAAEYPARLLLSWVPRYYEAKLFLIIWMLRNQGAETIYRWIRRHLRVLVRRLHLHTGFNSHSNEDAEAELKAIPTSLVVAARAAQKVERVQPDVAAQLATATTLTPTVRGVRRISSTPQDDVLSESNGVRTPSTPLSSPPRRCEMSPVTSPTSLSLLRTPPPMPPPPPLSVAFHFNTPSEQPGRRRLDSMCTTDGEPADEQTDSGSRTVNRTTPEPATGDGAYDETFGEGATGTQSSANRSLDPMQLKWLPAAVEPGGATSGLVNRLNGSPGPSGEDVGSSPMSDAECMELYMKEYELGTSGRSSAATSSCCSSELASGRLSEVASSRMSEEMRFMADYEASRLSEGGTARGEAVAAERESVDSRRRRSETARANTSVPAEALEEVRDVHVDVTQQMSAPSHRKEDGKGVERAQPASCAECTADEELRQLYIWLSTPEGAQALSDCSEIDDVFRSVLRMRSSEAAFLSPRYLQVHLIGTCDAEHAELPPTSRDSSDPYCTLRIIGPTGEVYPSEGVSSSICCRTTRPQWDQILEVRLRSGRVGERGFAQLRVDVHDAQVGMGAILLNFAETAELVLLSLVLPAYALGITDGWTLGGVWQAQALAFVLASTTALALIAHKVLRVDDIAIGRVECPLNFCLDKQMRVLELSLQPVTRSSLFTHSGAHLHEAVEVHTARNAYGGLGAIKLALAYAND